MTRERQLLGGSEDPYPKAGGLGLSRKYEGGFREVGFERDGLHLLSRQILRVENDSELVARVRNLGEDVEKVDLVAHGFPNEGSQ